MGCRSGGSAAWEADHYWTLVVGLQRGMRGHQPHTLLGVALRKPLLIGQDSLPAPQPERTITRWCAVTPSTCFAAGRLASWHACAGLSML